MFRLCLVFIVLVPVLLFGEQLSTSVNVLSNSNMDMNVETVTNFESSSKGKWSFFICPESVGVTQVDMTAPGKSGTGKALIVSSLSTQQGKVWNSVLYQDLMLIRPTRYELVFWVKSKIRGNTSINISCIKNNTNKLLASVLQTGIHYSTEWMPVVTYLDFSTCNYQDLENVRLNIHFAESGEYLIDDLSFRPQYLIPFGPDKDVAIDQLSFDSKLSPFFSQTWDALFSMPGAVADYNYTGGSANNAKLKYTIYPELGAKPIEGERSLFIDIVEVNGLPTYEVRFETAQITTEAIGKKIKLSFWAKTDSSMALLPAAQQQFRLVPRFQQSTNINIQLTPQWQRFEYDFNFSSLAYPDYKYFRFTFDKVNRIHIDALSLEYIDIPDYTAINKITINNNEVKFINQQGGVKVVSQLKSSLTIFDSQGKLYCVVEDLLSANFIALYPGIYIAKWENSKKELSTQKILVD
jgi:hypothetical protein